MRAWAWVVAAFVAIAGNCHAMAAGRVALVIGNAKYQHVPSLPNPANDAVAIALLLKSAGFDVVETRENLGVTDMRRAVREFSDQTQNAEIALIYFAGHGIEIGGANYLVPVDAALRRDLDVEDETVSLDRLLLILEPAKRLRLVILDACRENPFVKSMKRTMASRAIGRGLARIEPTTTDTLIAFAAKAGMTAADGDGLHSPFTQALLKSLVVPGLDVRIALGRVRDDVMKVTSNRQEPFLYGSLGGTTVTLASVSADERTDRPPADVDSLAARDYGATARVNTVEGWDAFIAKYPSGLYSDLAKAQRAKLVPPLPAEKSASRKQNSPSPNPKEPGTKRPKPDRGTQTAGSDSCLRNCVQEWLSRASCQGSHCVAGATSACRSALRASGGNCDRYR